MSPEEGSPRFQYQYWSRSGKRRILAKSARNWQVKGRLSDGYLERPFIWNGTNEAITNWYRGQIKIALCGFGLSFFAFLFILFFLIVVQKEAPGAWPPERVGRGRPGRPAADRSVTNRPAADRPRSPPAHPPTASLNERNPLYWKWKISNKQSN